VAEFQQNSLDEKSVLLEFAFGEKESYLWLIGKNEVSSYVLPPREVLENRIEKIRKVFDERQMLQGEDVDAYQKRINDLEQNSASEAKLLSNELFGQIVDKITDKRLIIVADGKLSLLPVSALPFPNSEDFFINRNEIVYQPSASLLSILPKLQTSKTLPAKDLLVFADPVFNDSDQRLTAKKVTESSLPTILGLNLRDFRLTDANGNIPRLFATQAEADSIADTVGKSRVEIVSGFAANREKVLDSTISDYRMLHFATHGLVDVQRPEVSSIVLSQFDEIGNKKEGFLRLQDIYSLNLASDLVVLSACESAVGKQIKGEGLMSLNNAFLQAGAKSVLSSAWKVDDDATAEFMKRFYANLVNKRRTTAEALRQTQLEMVNSTQYKSPFYWAAFTVNGEFRQPISVSTNYFYYVLFGVLAVLGVGLAWRFKKRFLAAD
jgi:CHAT domain-containing protein